MAHAFSVLARFAATPTFDLRVMSPAPVLSCPPAPVVGDTWVEDPADGCSSRRRSRLQSPGDPHQPVLQRLRVEWRFTRGQERAVDCGEPRPLAPEALV